MSSFKKDGEPLSSKAREEINLMSKIDGLLNQIEGEISRETGENVISEIRELLKKYRQNFGAEAGEIIKQYYKRVDEASKKIRREAA